LFGLEFLAAGMLYMAPTPVAAQIECRTKVPPKINVLPSKSLVKYDFTKSKANLNEVDVDTISPYGPQHNTTVSGLMSGSIQVQHQMAFMSETYEQLGQGCVYLKSIEVKVHIDPTIFIAREYPKGTCMHNAVLNHERKHVREDQLIVNKYSNYIGRALALVVDSQGAAFGPFDVDKIPEIQQNVQNSVTKVVKKFNDQMNLERQTRQQAIDSLEEYDNIGIKCKQR
jgi:hypothetical protein